MSLSKGDRSLQEELDWAMTRVAKAGFPVRSKVRLLVDPKLEIMGYASEEGGIQHIVIAEWALHSDMLGGLLFHELAHIYHSERGSPSHRYKMTNGIIAEFSAREGLNEREAAYLVEGFNHLQNVLVDDIVFATMDKSELAQTKDFFSGWLTDSPSGYALADASALARNAFAVASMRRHRLLDDADLADEVAAKERMLFEEMGEKTKESCEDLEAFLLEADAGWDGDTFQHKLVDYLDLLVALLREGGQMEDLR